MTDKKFDGFYFLPGDEDSDLTLKYFTFNAPEFMDAKPVDGTEVGDMYHIAFFRKSDDGDPIFDESFEAIFACPRTYIKQLAGFGLYGCVLRKTEKSGKWFDDYLNGIKNKITMASS